MFRRSRTRLCVHMHSCSLGILRPVLVFSMYDTCGPELDDVSLVDNRTHGGQRSFDDSVQELHVSLLAVQNEFQSRISFHTYGTTACCRQPHRVRRFRCRNALLSDWPDGLGRSGIDSDLHDLLRHVKIRFAFVVPSVRFSRRLRNPSRRSSRMLLNPLRRSSRISHGSSR